MANIGDQLNQPPTPATRLTNAQTLSIDALGSAPAPEPTLTPVAITNVVPLIKPSSKAALKPPPPKAVIAKQQAAPAAITIEDAPEAESSQDPDEPAQFDIPAVVSAPVPAAHPPPLRD